MHQLEKNTTLSFGRENSDSAIILDCMQHAYKAESTPDLHSILFYSIRLPKFIRAW